MSEPEPRYPDDALCAQVGYTDLWYPEKGASTREAKALCARCPVREACLEAALERGEEHGIFGGKSRRERRKIRNERELGGGGMNLYHYTCDHCHEAITDTLQPNGWPLLLVWLTDVDQPMRDALGLTSHSLSCDRTAHRYRVTDTSTAAPWRAYRRTIDPLVAHAIESTPGVKPMHWWVSVAPVPVVYDPIGGAA